MLFCFFRNRKFMRGSTAACRGPRRGFPWERRDGRERRFPYGDREHSVRPPRRPSVITLRPSTRLPLAPDLLRPCLLRKRSLRNSSATPTPFQYNPKTAHNAARRQRRGVALEGERECPGPCRGYTALWVPGCGNAKTALSKPPKRFVRRATVVPVSRAGALRGCPPQRG